MGRSAPRMASGMRAPKPVYALASRTLRTSRSGYVSTNAFSSWAASIVPKSAPSSLSWNSAQTRLDLPESTANDTATMAVRSEGRYGAGVSALSVRQRRDLLGLCASVPFVSSMYHSGRLTVCSARLIIVASSDPVMLGCALDSARHTRTQCLLALTSLVTRERGAGAAPAR